MIRQISDEEFDRVVASIEETKAARAECMPTEADALRVMFTAWQRLKELGWNNAIYCPKDGSEFSAIEAGSTGIHRCTYSGKWPDGHWWVHDGDTWPSRPILWRPRKPDDPHLDLGTAMEYDCRDSHA